MICFIYKHPLPFFLTTMPMIVFCAADCIMRELQMHGVEISAGTENVVGYASLGTGIVVGVILSVIFAKKDKQYHSRKWEIFSAIFYIAVIVILLLLSKLDENIYGKYFDYIKNKPV